MNSILSVNKVDKSFGNFKALNNVTLEVEKGSIFGLLGPNGAGKTTLIRIINQITLPDAGEIYFDGRRLHPNDVAQLGYLPEERGLYKSMKVGEQALYLAQLKGLSKQEALKRLKFWMEKFEIESWWNKKVEELSKGMAQKLQFIVTVLHQPKLLILDEPFSGFDPVNANIIKDEILALKEQGTTIIFSTHRMESVEELCDYIALINKSNLILEGNINEIKKKYKSNLFEIGLQTENNDLIFKQLSAQFEVKYSQFKSFNNDLKMTIKLPENYSQNNLLNVLMQKATVNHFVEVVPTVNEIFIKAVQEN
ncbi:MAG TPA: ATP-binding cassette domain-containing protein [Flavobacteriaceae bacterium]|nr:ATP-binding cassette domain-containing protein [Flavobacteriaceae bacterium]